MLVLYETGQITRRRETVHHKIRSTTHPIDVVIVGCIRDGSKYIDASMNSALMIAGQFSKSRIIVYENDSVDDTLTRLRRWEENTSIVDLISEENIPGKRTHRLAHARNTLMAAALALNPEYIVVMDMDDVNQRLTRDAFMTCFDVSEPWAVLGANSGPVYYDIWALRTLDSWMPCDFRSLSAMTMIPKRIVNIPFGTSPIEVNSCFGGLAIYRTEFIDASVWRLYDGGDSPDGPERCEHVSLHSHIRKQGGRIFINPKMINRNIHLDILNSDFDWTNWKNRRLENLTKIAAFLGLDRCLEK